MDEKRYRLNYVEQKGSLYGLKRLRVLAKDRDNPAQPGQYFETFRTLYPAKSQF
jgi:hypothetical protein